MAPVRPPHDLATEAQLLGAAMLDPAALAGVVEANGNTHRGHAL